MAEGAASTASGAGAAVGAGGAPAPAPDGAPANTTSVRPLSWRDVWQLPTLVLSAALLILGVATALKQKPKVDPSAGIRAAATLIDRGEYEAAIDTLNRGVLPYLETPASSPDVRREFHLNLGRAIHLGQHARGLRREENFRNIAGQFGEAEARNATLTENDLYYFANASIELGRFEKGLELADRVGITSPQRRIGLYRMMVEAEREVARPDLAHIIELTSRLLADAELPAEDRAWATARQAEVQLAQGHPETVMLRLLRELPRMQGASADARGELHLRLGQAYFSQGDLARSSEQLLVAADLVPADSPLAAEVQLNLGRVYELTDELDLARERYEQIISRYQGSPWLLSAKLGLAEVLATKSIKPTGEGEPELKDRAIEAYQAVVAALNDGERSRDVTRERLSRSLHARAAERFDLGDSAAAVRYAVLGESLWRHGEEQADLLLILARANRRQAEETIMAAGKDPTGDLSEIDGATLRHAQAYYRAAASYFRKHAQAVVLADNRGYGDSLFAAADAADRAGDVEFAAAALQEFASGFPSDARQPEAKYRLARALQAQGSFESAAELFGELIEGRDAREGMQGSGIYADMSYVPLAQSLLLDGDPGNDDDAERKLLTAISGALGGPTTNTYREAIFELGAFYYERARYPRAIDILEQSVARYPNDPRVDRLRFRLADCYRLSAASAATRLKDAMPNHERRPLEALRAEHLGRAVELFREAASGLESKEANRRTALDELYLRNARFYAGDCLFDLGEFQEAIRAYDFALERYPRDPASLVAMMQIVSAYLKLGDTARARTVNQRALGFYKSLPASVWDDPNLPMSRESWERWLAATAELHRTEAGRTAGAGD